MPASDKLKQSYYDDLSQEEVQEKKLAHWTDRIRDQEETELIIGREREYSRGKRDSAIIPTKGTPSQSWMLSDLADCVQKHKCIDVEEKLSIIDDKYPIIQQLEQDIKTLCDLID